VRIHRGKNEDDEVALRDVILRDRLVIFHDRVRAGRIDDRDFAEHLPRQRDALPGIAERFDAALGSVNQLLNADRARPRCDLANIFAQKGVDEAALARFDFTNDDEQRRGLKIRQPGAQNLGRFNIGASFRQPQRPLELRRLRRQPCALARIDVFIKINRNSAGFTFNQSRRQTRNSLCQGFSTENSRTDWKFCSQSNTSFPSSA